LFSGPLCSILSGRKAKWVNAAVIVIIAGICAGDRAGICLYNGAFSGALGK
jgi:hypothetical protein